MTKKYLKESEFLKEIQDRLIPQHSSVTGKTGWKKHTNLYAHYKNGHYENDPALGIAIINFDNNGEVRETQSRVNGVCHSDDGPAQVYYSSGTQYKNIWWLNGVQVSAAEFETYKTNKASTYVDVKVADGSTKKINKKTLENIKKYLKGSYETTPTGDIVGLSIVPSLDLHSEKLKIIEKFSKFIFVTEDNMIYATQPNFFGPSHISFNTDDTVCDASYAVDNITDSITQYAWKAKMSSFVNGIPFWVRHTQLEKYGFDKTQSFTSITKEQEQKVGYEVLSKDHPVRFAYLGTDGMLYLVFKDPSEPGVFYEKTVPIQTFFKDIDGKVSVLLTEFEGRHDTYKRAKYSIANGRLDIKVVESITAAKFEEVANKVNSYNNVNGIEKKPEITFAHVDKVIAEISENVVKQLEIEMRKQSKDAEEITLADIQILKDNVEKINKMLNNIQFNVNGEIKTDISHTSEVLDPKLREVIPIGVAQNATVTTNKIKLTTEPEIKSENKLVQTIKSDAVEVAKRIAANKIITLINNLVIKTMIQKVGGKHKATLMNFFESTNGKAFVSIATGMLLPLLTDKLPEQYRPYLNEIGDEFRVSGEVDIVSQLADFATGPLFASVADSLSTMELFSGINPERVRIDTSERGSASDAESEEHEEFIANNKENYKELN